MVPKSFTEYFTSLDETGRMAVVTELTQMLNPDNATKVLADIYPVFCAFFKKRTYPVPFEHLGVVPLDFLGCYQNAD